MRKLVPADPVWLGHFLAMEDPLLHQLKLEAEQLYPSQLPSGVDWPMVVADAYQSWFCVYQALPHPLRALAERVKVAGERVWRPAGTPGGYALHGPTGRSGVRYVELYHVEVDGDDLASLADFLHRSRAARASLPDEDLLHSLQQIADDLVAPGPDGEPALGVMLERFERSLAVLSLQPDEVVLEAIPAGAIRAGSIVILDQPQEAALKSFSRQISDAVTGGDPVASQLHQTFMSSTPGS